MNPLDFSRDRLNEELQAIYDLVGHDIMAKIVARFGGSSLYIPRPTRLGLAERNALVWENFNGHNHKELARRFDLSVRHVRSILESERKARRPGEGGR